MLGNLINEQESPQSNSRNICIRSCIWLIDFSMSAFRWTVRIAGILLSTAALLLMAGCAYVWLTIGLPMLTSPGSLSHLFNLGIAAIVIFNLFFNFIQVVRTHPGSTTSNWLERIDSNDENNKWCRKCDKAKPPRAHHCHVCNTCISRMDHHCPWINNCVGYQNHRYFYLFLFYLFFGAVYTSIGYALAAFDVLNVDHQVWRKNEAQLTLVGVLSASVSVAIGGFLGWHSYLMLTNQTTIEFQLNRMGLLPTHGPVNPYDIGIQRNLYQMFGTDSVWRILLPSVRTLPSDGCSFPTLDDPSDKDPRFLV
eukprot:gb/GECH01009531.1/.p1 GENE.gb/GECH01009531.1/~~gb/GECH01009531.1/.p1  ORF type:complete len:309 (+),score=37.67 gb/GECH01009531.1/:1-927(+)